MSMRRGLFFLLCNCLALVACLSCGTAGEPAPSAEGTPAQIEPSAYRLGAGDELRILVFGREEFSGEFAIDAQGRIAYPLIGSVEAAGLTAPELSTTLASALSNGYVVEPNVSVDVTAYRPFYILGEVNKPGAYPYSPGLTVMSAVATAGGFSYRANSRRVYIQHNGQSSERYYSLTSSTPVQPGDTVRIPERQF